MYNKNVRYVRHIPFFSSFIPFTWTDGLSIGGNMTSRVLENLNIVHYSTCTYTSDITRINAHQRDVRAPIAYRLTWDNSFDKSSIDVCWNFLILKLWWTSLKIDFRLIWFILSLELQQNFVEMNRMLWKWMYIFSFSQLFI